MSCQPLRHGVRAGRADHPAREGAASAIGRGMPWPGRARNSGPSMHPAPTAAPHSTDPIGSDSAADAEAFIFEAGSSDHDFRQEDPEA